MKAIPPAIVELFYDPEGKRAEDCLRKLLVELEAAKIKPEAIAKALSRVTIGFCASHGKDPEKYGWAVLFLHATGEALQRHAAMSRRRWVTKFLKKHGRLYEDASHGIRMDWIADNPMRPETFMPQVKGNA